MHVIQQLTISNKTILTTRFFITNHEIPIDEICTFSFKS